jgi:predicted enzyme related to lactoylglutathione lyase
VCASGAWRALRGASPSSPLDGAAVVTLSVLANIDVDNLVRATEFYCDVLGLRVGRRIGNSVVELLGGSTAIYLLEKASDTVISPTSTARRVYRRHWTPVHLDFVVQDILASVARAQSGGAALEGKVRTYSWGHIAAMADPFGNGFCLIEFIGRGYDEIAS